MTRYSALLLALLISLLVRFPGHGQAPTHAAPSAPLAIGETFTLTSSTLGETRRINVYLPPGYEKSAGPVPVLYMPDGGLAEDFLHVAGLVQVSVGNGTMRPFLLVGIENTERRRDLTGPTTNAQDRKIAPRVGGAASFRKFIRTELMPVIRQRYRTTGETAVVGESLAGLFIVETFLLEPDLFDSYLAFDPSLWWNDEYLVHHVDSLLRTRTYANKHLYLATSDEPRIMASTQRLTRLLEKKPVAALSWHYDPMPAETHGTIYHPAALKAFRLVLKPRQPPLSPLAR